MQIKKSIHHLFLYKLKNTKFFVSANISMLSFVIGICLFQYSAKFNHLITDDISPIFLLILLLIGLTFYVFLWRFFQIKFPWRIINIFGKISFYINIIICGFLYAHNFGYINLSALIPVSLAGEDFIIEVTTKQPPKKSNNSLRYDFEVVRLIQPPLKINYFNKPKVRLSEYYKSDQDLTPKAIGSAWIIKARLYPIHGNYSPNAFDYEGWLFQKGYVGTGSIREWITEQKEIDKNNFFENIFLIDKLRNYLLTRLNNFYKNQKNINSEFEIPEIITVLGLGEQANLSTESWKILRQSGTIHLFSISGVHVTLLAILIAYIVNLLWRNNLLINYFYPQKRIYLCNYIPTQFISISVGLICAWVYALLSGFALPTERTVLMLSFVYALIFFGKKSSKINILIITLLFMSTMDPMAVLDNGFWLSFCGVGLLIFFGLYEVRENKNILSVNELKPKNNFLRQKIFSFIKTISTSIWQLIKIQFVFSIVLLPLMILFFHEYSTVSVIANLIAIPLISWALVPLAILIIIYPFNSGITLIANLQEWFFIIMQKLVLMSPSIITAPPSIVALVFAIFGIFYLLLPKGVINKWLVLIFLIPIVITSINRPDKGFAKIMVFDVGAGLSVLVQTKNHNLLYDSGAKVGGFVPAEFIISPFLQGQGIDTIDAVILSHTDNDHSGGFTTINNLFTINKLWLGNTKAKWDEFFNKYPITDINAVNKKYCQNLWQSWNWDDVQFSVAQADIKDGGDNNNSCILKVTAGNKSILITGDIEKASMEYFTQKYPEVITSTYLLIPHHGSNTSAYPPFYKIVNPQYAVVSAGLKQIKYPTAEIRQSLNDLIINHKIPHTWFDGTIIINLNSENSAKPPQTYREIKPRYWHNFNVS